MFSAAVSGNQVDFQTGLHPHNWTNMYATIDIHSYYPKLKTWKGKSLNLYFLHLKKTAASAWTGYVATQHCEEASRQAMFWLLRFIEKRDLNKCWVPLNLGNKVVRTFRFWKNKVKCFYELFKNSFFWKTQHNVIVLIHKNLQNKIDPLYIHCPKHVNWMETTGPNVMNIKMQGSLKEKMLQLYAFSIMQLCLAPVFCSSPCSWWCSLLLTPEGHFVSGACLVSLSKWLPALTHSSAAFVRVFCPETLYLPLCFPFICNWSYKTKGWLPNKPYLRESSSVLVT